MRIEFLQTLCMADRLGFLDCIEHICAQLHKSQSNGASNTGRPQLASGSTNIRQSGERAEVTEEQDCVVRPDEELVEGMKGLKLDTASAGGGKQGSHNRGKLSYGMGSGWMNL